MNTDVLLNLFQSVNRDTVKLIDSLSGLSSLSELNSTRDEMDLHSDVLRVLLENQSIEYAALFLQARGQLNLSVSAQWDRTHILTLKRRQGWELYDVSGEEGVIATALVTQRLQQESCKKLPLYFTPLESQEQEQAVVVGIRQQAGSQICIPLVNRNICYGVLCLYHRQRDYFNSAQEQFLTLFCRMYMQMLLNFRYANDLQDQVNQRTQQLEKALLAARRLQNDFHNLALVDELTGLPNRRFFCAETQTALARSLRHQRALSCCIIELSNFTQLSEQMNFFDGDQLLMALADVLKLQVREGDILAFLRGEQFILSLPEVTVTESRQFAERIMAVLQDMRDNDVLGEMQLQFGLSTLDCFESHCTELALEQLMTQADMALKAGKSTGEYLLHYTDMDLSALGGCSVPL